MRQEFEKTICTSRVFCSRQNVYGFFVCRQESRFDSDNANRLSVEIKNLKSEGLICERIFMIN